MLLGEQAFHHSIPMLAFQDADTSFAQLNKFFIRIDELRGKALHAIKTVEMIPSWEKIESANGRIAARLGDFASTQLGRAASGFLFKDGEAILDAKIIRKLADLVAQRGSNIGLS